MLTAAVVSRRFCNLLLSDPYVAVQSGYNGKSFALSQNELAVVLSIDATSLTDFTTQLIAKSTAEWACEPSNADALDLHPIAAYQHRENAIGARSYA